MLRLQAGIGFCNDVVFIAPRRFLRHWRQCNVHRGWLQLVGDVGRSPGCGTLRLGCRQEIRHRQ